jgi:hypothetical protein
VNPRGALYERELPIVIARRAALAGPIKSRGLCLCHEIASASRPRNDRFNGNAVIASSPTRNDEIVLRKNPRDALGVLGMFYVRHGGIYYAAG